MTKTKEIIQFLSKFTPCDISDGLVQFGLSNGGYLPNLILRSKFPLSVSASSVVGPAYTVLYAPKSDPRPAVKQSYIDEIPEDSVLVIGLPDSCQRFQAPYVTVNNALYGGLMSTRAKYRKANGSVILGRIRDLDEHNDLEYPVWSYGVGLTAPGPVVKVVGINVPINVKVSEGDGDTIKVNPGDFIVADKNGVVVLDKENEKFQEILDYIPKRVAADQRVSEDIKNGKGATESQKL